jgi:hypothetical protein
VKKKTNVKEIGGDYSLSDIPLLLGAGDSKGGLFASGSILLDSGRSAFRYLLGALKYDQVILLPAYLCESVLAPLGDYGVKFDFYRINADLSIDMNDLKSKISKKTKMIYIIKYFGFDFNREEREFMRNTACKILLDVSHSLTAGDDRYDYLIGSLRKILPVPDGGILFSKRPIAGSNIERSQPSSYLNVRLAAMLLKSWSLGRNIGEKQNYLDIFARSEALLDRQKSVYSISSVSEEAIRLLSLENMIKRRKANFEYLKEKLGLKGISKQIAANSPIYKFPLLVAAGKRNKLLRLLIKNDIYASRHWPCLVGLNKDLYKGAASLAAKMLAIPIDQRYGRPEMERIVSLLEQYV